MKRKGLMVAIVIILLFASNYVLSETNKTIYLGQKVLLFSSTYTTNKVGGCIIFNNNSSYPVSFWTTWEVKSTNSGFEEKKGNHFVFLI
jgi:hypothetical protein